jgi:predicted transcriptional regulator
MGDFLEIFYLLETLDALIRRQNTGNCQRLAKRLEISERSVFRLLSYLSIIVSRDRIKIRYDKKKNTYYYSQIDYFFNHFSQKTFPKNN